MTRGSATGAAYASAEPRALSLWDAYGDAVLAARLPPRAPPPPLPSAPRDLARLLNSDDVLASGEATPAALPAVSSAGTPTLPYASSPTAAPVTTPGPGRGALADKTHELLLQSTPSAPSTAAAAAPVTPGTVMLGPGPAARAPAPAPAPATLPSARSTATEASIPWSPSLASPEIARARDGLAPVFSDTIPLAEQLRIAEQWRYGQDGVGAKSPEEDGMWVPARPRPDPATTDPGARTLMLLLEASPVVVGAPITRADDFHVRPRRLFHYDDGAADDADIADVSVAAVDTAVVPAIAVDLPSLPAAVDTPVSAPAPKPAPAPAPAPTTPAPTTPAPAPAQRAARMTTRKQARARVTASSLASALLDSQPSDPVGASEAVVPCTPEPAATTTASLLELSAGPPQADAATATLSAVLADLHSVATPMPTFTTGAGRKLAPLSTASLESAAKRFEEPDESPGMPTFTTGAGRKLAPLSAASLESAAKRFEEPDEAEPRPAAETAPFAGFRSGNGRSLDPVRPESLQAARDKFALLDSDSGDVSRLTALSTGSASAGPPLKRVRAPAGDADSSSAKRVFASSRPFDSPTAFDARDARGMPVSSATPSTSLSFRSPAIVRAPPAGMGGAKRLFGDERPTTHNASDADAVAGDLAAARKSARSDEPVAPHRAFAPLSSPILTRSPHPGTPRSGIANRRPFKAPSRVAPPAAGAGTASMATKAAAGAVVSRTLFDMGGSTGPRTTLAQARDQTLAELSTQNGYHTEHIPEHLLAITAQNAAEYRFEHEGAPFGPSEAHTVLLDAGAIPSQVSFAWVTNHFRWIVWKLAAEERSFAQLVGQRLTAAEVVNQLKYRYEREINLCHRSALKLIAEKDGAAARPMVLCVCEIRAGEGDAATLVLTDGWYAMPALLDAGLQALVGAGKITVGMKLRVLGADLMGHEEACPPLELRASVHLKLCVNGTRRAAWDARMGYVRFKRRPMPLAQARVGGGTIPYLDVVVLRRFPEQFEERYKGGERVVRSAQEEEDHQRLLLEQQQRRHEQSAGGPGEMGDDAERRDVTVFFKVRIGDYPRAEPGGPTKPTAAVLKIYRPDENTFALFAEGRRVKIYGASAGVTPARASSASSAPSLFLFNSRSTRWLEAPADPVRLQRSLYVARTRLTLGSAAPEPRSQHDLVVCVAAVSATERVNTQGGRVRFVRHLWLLDETSEQAGATVPRLAYLKWWSDEPSVGPLVPKAVVCLGAVLYGELLEEVDVHVLTMHHESSLTTHPPTAALRQAKSRLDTWLVRNAFAVSRIVEHAQTMLERGRPDRVEYRRPRGPAAPSAVAAAPATAYLDDYDDESLAELDLPDDLPLPMTPAAPHRALLRSDPDGDEGISRGLPSSARTWIPSLAAAQPFFWGTITALALAPRPNGGLAVLVNDGAVTRRVHVQRTPPLMRLFGTILPREPHAVAQSSSATARWLHERCAENAAVTRTCTRKQHQVFDVVLTLLSEPTPARSNPALLGALVDALAIDMGKYKFHFTVDPVEPADLDSVPSRPAWPYRVPTVAAQSVRGAPARAPSAHATPSTSADDADAQ